MGNLDKKTKPETTSRRPVKNRHWLLFVGMVLTASCSTMPSPKSIASTNLEPTQGTIAANFLAARQALYFRDIGASAEFYLTALNFDHDNASLLQQAFYTQYQLGHIDAAAAIARNMEMLNLTTSYASEPATAKAILLEDWDAVLVLADDIAENLDAQPVATVIKAWALTAKGQGAAGLSHLLKIGKASTKDGQEMPSVFAIQAARLSAHIGNDAELWGFADGLFNRQNLPSQILLQLASLYARHGDTAKMAQLIDRLPTGFDKKALQNQLLNQTEPPEITSHIAAGIIDTSLINSQSQIGGMLNARLGLALYLDPQIDSARFLLAQALNEMEQYQAAITNLDAIDVAGAWGQPQLLLRVDLERKDNMTGAIALMQTAVDKDGDNALLQKELGDLYRMSDQFEKARDAYLMALDLGLASGDLDRNLGISYEQLEQDQLAEDSFKAALAKNPNDPYTLNYLGYWWADDGRNLDEAIKLIEQAVRLRPRSGYFVDSLGWVYYKLGNYDLAVAFLEKATILEPMDAVITGHLGDAYWETGRYAEARFKWQYALSIATEDDLKSRIYRQIKAMITVVAPAKINLFLRICGKTDAGYHLLDSAIVFTRFGDHLTIEPANGDRLAITGEFSSELESADDNLVMVALRGFRAAGGVIGGLSITLEKNIPVGAGLGGGSADAAALLGAVNALSSMPLGKDALYHLAASLGADVPVCLAGGCQRIAGIGEEMTSIDLNFSGAILLVNPRIPLSTKEVFTLFTDPMSGFAGSVSNLDAADMIRLGNDLTATAIKLAPAINNCLNRLAGSKGAIVTAMSGSGASCFALFDHADNAEIAAIEFKNAGYWARASMIDQPD